MFPDQANDKSGHEHSIAGDAGLDSESGSRIARPGAVLARFCLSWVWPVGLVWRWLFKAGASGAYFEQVFLKGPLSKGSLLSVLTRPLWMPFMDKMFLEHSVIVLAILGWLWATLQFSPPRPSTTRSGPLRLMLAFLAGAGAILLGVFLCAHVPGSAYLVKVEGVATYLSFLGSLGQWLYYLGLWIRRRVRSVDSQLWLFSAVSFTVACMLALSWAAYEPMVVPGLAWVIAFLLDRLQGTSPANTLIPVYMRTDVARPAVLPR